MNISKNKKTQVNISKKLVDIFDADSDSENLEFEEMVINSDAIQVIAELMKENNIIPG